MSDSLSISTTEFETDPSGSETYVSLDFSLEARPFAGRSNCVVLERDLLAFLADLDMLAKTSKGEALLAGGWGESEYVRLEVSPQGSLGHLTVRVLLREYEPSSDFRVEGSLARDPIQISRFAVQLRRTVKNRTLHELDL